MTDASPVKGFVAGGFGGVCVILVGQPLDFLKVRLQTMPRPAPGQSPLYSGTLDCAKKTLRHEGIRGFYKGMAAPLVGVAPIFSLSFAGNEFGKKIQQNNPREKLSLGQLFIAGGIAGFCSTTIMAPGSILYG